MTVRSTAVIATVALFLPLPVEKPTVAAMAPTPNVVASDSVGADAATRRSAWGPSVTLSGPQDAWAVASAAPPSSAVAPHGTAIVVWAQRQRVMIASRPPHGPWTSPRTLHRSHAGTPWQPQIAVDSAGDRVVVWEQGHSVRAMRRPSAGVWHAPVKIATLPRRQQVVSRLTLAVGENGTTLVAFWRGWIRRCGFDDCFLDNVNGATAIRRPSGSWQQPRPFAGPFDNVHGFINPALAPGMDLLETPAAVVYDEGTITVGWAKPGYLQSAPAYARTKSPGSPWRDRIRLTAGRKVIWHAPLLTATAGGQVTAAWTQLSGRTRIWSRTKSAGGAWGPRQRVSRRGELVGLDIDDVGEAIALLWKRRARGGSETVTKTRPRGGRWGSRDSIGSHGWASQLEVNPTGEGVAAGKTGRAVVASYRTSPGSWAAVTRLDSKGTAPLPLEVSVGHDDTAIVAWYRYRGGRQRTVVLKAAVHPPG
jgi:hypothetical protein